MNHLASRTAAALPLVLWAVFVMSTVVVVALGLIDFDLDMESLAAKRFEARQVAMTGVAYAQHPEVLRWDPLLSQKFEDGSELHVHVQNEDARLNINKMLSGEKSSMVNLFRFWGMKELEADTLADSLKDWVDPDEFRSLNGAEAADIPVGGEFSRPENRPFLAVAEMEKVKGMDALVRVKPDWAEYFSVRSSNRLDLQDASEDFLQVFGGLTKSQAEQVAIFRNGGDKIPGTKDDNLIEDVDALAAVVPLSQSQREAFDASFGTEEGGLKRIISTGKIGGVNHEITVIAAGGGGGPGGGFVEWTEK